MQQRTLRVLLSLILLGMAGSLFWYCVCTKKIEGNDADFVQRCPFISLFPEVPVMRGKIAYYRDLDYGTAARYYREALSRQPLRIDVWLALAKVDLDRGDREEARRMLDTLRPLICHVSTWKWQEFLLAYELRDESAFVDTFNFILSRLPARIGEACYLARQFGGNPASGLSYVAAENYEVYLKQLMTVGAVDESWFLWQRMEKSSPAPDRRLALRFCDYLVQKQQWSRAKALWKRLQEKEAATGFRNGDFEQEPLDIIFDWRFVKHPEVDVDRICETPYTGSSCLHLHFRGSQNVVFNHVTQVIPAEGGRTYRLRFASKSRNLTTDQGVFVEVRGYQCKGLHAESEPVIGTRPWTVEQMEVRVPDGCEAVSLRVRRKESLMFDNRISGDYWLDAVEWNEE